MAKRREPMSEGKKNIIASLLQEYDIKTADDIQEPSKDLLGGTLQSMLEAEMDDHLGYAPYERTDNPNALNGKKSKTIRSKNGEMNIDVPQDRESSFKPKVVRKRQRDISGIEDIYGIEVSEGMVSDITNKLLSE